MPKTRRDAARSEREALEVAYRNATDPVEKERIRRDLERIGSREGAQKR